METEVGISKDAILKELEALVKEVRAKHELDTFDRDNLKGALRCLAWRMKGDVCEAK